MGDPDDPDGVTDPDLAPFRDYCEFGRDRVYLLVAVAREKERGDGGAEQGDADAGSPTLRRVVEDAADLERTAGELAHATRQYGPRYRLYLTVNARDVLRAFFALRERMDEWLRQRLGGNRDVDRKFARVDGEFLSVLQSEESRAEKRFLFDLDDATPEEAARFREALAAETTVRLDRETPNGYHLVTDPFDYTAFGSDVSYELKRDDLVFVSYVD